MKKIIYLFICSFVFSNANAALYDFDVTHNGVSTFLDPGSDNPIGTNLDAGADSFNYNVGAQGNDFWQVNTGGNFFPFLSFQTLVSGTRTANFILTLFLDGAEQFTTSENGASNSFVHIGTNTINLATGLQFDELVLEYDLLNSDNVNNTISAYFFGGRTPEFFDGIAYVNNSAPSVPEPVSFSLLGLGLAGMFFSRKKKAA